MAAPYQTRSLRSSFPSQTFSKDFSPSQTFSKEKQESSLPQGACSLLEEIKMEMGQTGEGETRREEEVGDCLTGFSVVLGSGRTPRFSVLFQL